MKTPQAKAQQLFWVGIGVFIALGAITAVWFLKTGTLPLAYALVMIPLSAIGVICIFNARMVKMEAGISKLHDLNAWVANHEERITITEREIKQIKEFLIERHNYSEGFVDGAVSTESPQNGSVLRFSPRGSGKQGG